MIGAVIGDIAGSFREFSKPSLNKYETLPLFPSDEDIAKYNLEVGVTDDTVLTYATLLTLHQIKSQDVYLININDFAVNYKEIGLKYFDPIGGYGGSFRKWLKSDSLIPYNSCGNGSAMRISPIPYFCKTIDEVLHVSFLSSCATHNHPEGIKGAQATALAIYLAMQGLNWTQIKEELVGRFLSYDPISHFGYFDQICQETMRLVFWCLDNSYDFETAVKKAVTIKHADSDTIGAIVGSIAEHLYGIPCEYIDKAFEYLSKFPDIRMEFKKYYVKIER
jgi:ADP-ribosyl-[dinitrogen reductase] hydrolase